VCTPSLLLLCVFAGVQALLDISQKFGIHAQVVGRVEAKEGKAEVVVRSEHGEFTY